MRRLDFILTEQVKETQTVSFEDHEEYILIMLNGFNEGVGLTYLLTGHGANIFKNPITARPFIRIKRNQYDKLQLATTSFLDGSTIEGNIYIGTWSEMMIFDLSEHLPLLNHSLVKDEPVNFRIGDERGSNLLVTTEQDKDYRLKKTMVFSKTQSIETNDTVLKESETSALLLNVHEGIRLNSASLTMDNSKSSKALETHYFLTHY